jgi:hypothetical protein
MAITIKERPKGQESRAESIKRKYIEKCGRDLKSFHKGEVPFEYKLPERVVIKDLMVVFKRSRSAIAARVKSHVIPRPDGRDGGRPWWHGETIKALFAETLFERLDRIERARAEARKQAAIRYAAEGGGDTMAKAQAVVNARIASIPRESKKPGKPRRAQHLKAVEPR